MGGYLGKEPVRSGGEAQAELIRVCTTVGYVCCISRALYRRGLSQDQANPYYKFSYVYIYQLHFISSI